MLNNYNRVARIYSILSTLVFGSSLFKIQQVLVEQLPLEGEVLILGGGNGKILIDIYSIRPNLEIVYQEASSKMIELSKSNSPANQNIRFVHSDSLDNISQYRFIYCAFFLDLFTEKKLQTFLSFRSQKQLWFVADFRLNDVRRYKALRLLQIKLSIIFFKLTTGHSTNQLPDIRSVFHSSGYNSMYTKDLSHGFLCAEVFASPEY